MVATILPTDDPGVVLDRAGGFLASDPIRHNLMLTLLRTRVAHPEPGRYWVVEQGGRVAGVVFQSPLDFRATLTPMPAEAVTAAVDAIVDRDVVLPGVEGAADTAARFAGHWAERTRLPARPVDAMRIYELAEEPPPPSATGQVRRARQPDRDLLVRWFGAFQTEVHELPIDVGSVVDRRLAAGHLWVWEDGPPVALAGLTDPVAGVTRIGPVYTPHDRRNSGYASALVGSVSGTARAGGLRCVLYTELANPTSNAIYRDIGYRPVAEVLRYRFGEAT